MQRSIDWEQIPVAIEPIDEPNPQNPYAAESPQERAERLGALARQILLRRVRRIAQN
jgi:hypothetical protein